MRPVLVPLFLEAAVSFSRKLPAPSLTNSLALLIVMHPAPIPVMLSVSKAL